MCAFVCVCVCVRKRAGEGFLTAGKIHSVRTRWVTCSDLATPLEEHCVALDRLAVGGAIGPSGSEGARTLRTRSFSGGSCV